MQRLWYGIKFSRFDIALSLSLFQFFQQMLGGNDFFKDRRYGRTYTVLRLAGVLVNTVQFVDTDVDNDHANVLTTSDEYEAHHWQELMKALEIVRKLVMRKDARLHYTASAEEKDESLISSEDCKEVHALFEGQYRPLVQSLKLQQVISYLKPLFEQYEEEGDDELALQEEDVEAML